MRIRARDVFKFNAVGVRSAVAVVLPMIAGQIAGRPALGLMVGLGAFYVTMSDKEGSTPASMSAATILVALAGGIGTAAGAHPRLSVILIGAEALLGGLAGLFGAAASSVGYAVSIAFAVALGYSAGEAEAIARGKAFAVGGLWAILAALALWKWKERAAEKTGAPAEARKAVALSAEERRTTIRHAVRLAVAATTAMALNKFLHFNHGSWMVITVLVVMRPDLEETRERNRARMIGTTFGGILGAILAAFVRNTVVLDILMIFFVTEAYSHGAADYQMLVFFLTPFIVLMLNTLTPGDWRIALVRIVNVLAGGAIALAASYPLRPRESASG